MKRRLHIFIRLIILFSLFFVLAIGGITGAFYIKKQPWKRLPLTPTPIVDTGPVILPQDQWVLYANTVYSYQFKYPPSLTLSIKGHPEASTSAELMSACCMQLLYKGSSILDIDVAETEQTLEENKKQLLDSNGSYISDLHTTQFHHETALQFNFASEQVTTIINHRLRYTFSILTTAPSVAHKILTTLSFEK